jgi:diguanylate cyclase (GGDEF)-like protein
VSSAQDLSAIMGQFARVIATDFPVERILDELVRCVVEVLPVDAAGVTVDAVGFDVPVVAGSDDVVLGFQRVHGELADTPSQWSRQFGEPVTVPDLSQESRFVDFATAAQRHDVQAVFSFPLRHGAQPIGALDLYRYTTGALSPDAEAIAQSLADVAASYLVNAQLRADLLDAAALSLDASLHDPLTGLPNRTLIIDRLGHAIQRSRRSGETSAVFYLDIDRFKSINDMYGHTTGDELLAAVATRLTSLLRPGDTLARLTGDEFVILCEGFEDPLAAASVLKRLEFGLHGTFHVHDGLDLPITISAGIAFTDGAERSPDEILHFADLAMTSAKQRGGDGFVVFDRQSDSLAEREATLERDLRGALERSELATVYQPIVSTVDGQLNGFEALLRWYHPTRGSVPPAMVIPVAERSSSILEIGDWVLKQAWSERRRWQLQLPHADLAMSVNVSTRQLMSRGYADDLETALDDLGADPRLLTLEITESVFLGDSDRAVLVLNDLKDLGVRLALDDFGTGYSSLSYLRQFPLDILKIDRAFVSNLEHDRTSQVIVRAVIELAHGLNMSVVAEGVETPEQHQQLTELGSDSCQGYYFARPMPADTVDELVRQGANGHYPRLPVLSGVR